MRIAFIVNGKIWKGALVISKISSQLKKEGWTDCSFYKTSSPGDAILLANEACKKHDYIIAVGGDGTLNEVVNGVMGYSKPNEINVGQLPIGTANDFAKTVGLTTKISDLFQLIKSGKIKKVDLGHCTFYSLGNTSFNRYFINISNVGMAAEIVEKVNNGRKIFGPSLSYIFAISGTVLSHTTEEIHLIADTFSWRGKAKDIAIANGKFLGSGLGISPESKIDDGKFNVIVLGDFSYMDFIKYLPDIKKSKIISHPMIEYYQCTTLTVDCPTASLLVEMDGEFVGYTKANYKILREKLNFITAV